MRGAGLDGWSPAGATVDGPGAAVALVRDPAGALHLALRFGAEHARHPLLREGLDPIATFLAAPGVDRVAPLVARDRDGGTFVYPVGEGALLATIIERCAERNQPAGIRAALELVEAVGPLLDDAAKAGRRAGLPGHGGLNPWRVHVDGSGATVVGHGVPAIEVVTWLEGRLGRSAASAAQAGVGLRYFAPERVDEGDEDLRADLYALAVSAAELAMGGALLTGDGEALVKAIQSGAAAIAVRAGLSAAPGLGELLAHALAVDPADRPSSGRWMAGEASKLLRDAAGGSLFALASGAEARAAPVEVVSPPARAPAADPGAATVDGLEAPYVEEEGEEDAEVAPTAALAAPYPLPARAAPSRAPDARRAPTPVPQPAPEPEPDVFGYDESDDTAPTEVPPDATRLEPVAVRAPDEYDANDAYDAYDDLEEPTSPLDPGADAPASAVPRDPFDDDETDPLEDDQTDVIEEPLPAAASPYEAPAPIEDVPRDASLDAIQRSAHQIVERTAEVARRATALAGLVAERATAFVGQDQVARQARIAAERAVRSADSARSAAVLIELDEDATGASITLDLVRNSELQCEGALAEVAAQQRELDRVAERIAALARARADATRRASDHADRATDQANRADDLVTELERLVSDGVLTSGGTKAVIERAIASAEVAHAAARDARRHADTAHAAGDAEGAARAAEAARRAEEAAGAGLDATREAVDRARHAEIEAQAIAIDQASEASNACRAASDEASGALSRAGDAMALAATSESRELYARLAPSVRAAQAAATEAAEAADEALTASTAAVAEQAAARGQAAVAVAVEAAGRARDASDRIVALAGEEAEARARRSKLEEEAHALHERAKSQVARVREEVDRLLEDTSRISDAQVVAERAEAQAALLAATDGLRELDATVQRALEGEVDEAIVADERRLAGVVTAAVERAREIVASTRSLAEAQLADLRRREEIRRAIATAATEARDHAARCRALVDEAWLVARNLSDTLADTQLDDAIRQRTKALEIIDIAEFQAGEAAASADLAAAEADPSEARAHAQTSSSFLDRITADLPEALELLASAEAAAKHEVSSKASARARTAEVAAAIEQIAADAKTLFAALCEEASPWHTDDAVVAQLGLLDQSVRAFGEDLNEAGWARDRAEKARTGIEATEVVPNADAAMARARDKKRKLDAVVETARRSIAAAESAATAVEEAMRAAKVAEGVVATELKRLELAEARVSAAIEAHDAREEPALHAKAQLGEAVADAKRIQRELVSLVAGADRELGRSDQRTAADGARRMAQQVSELRLAVERLAELAADAETKGIAAAEHEARSRAEEARQRVQRLREAAAGEVIRVGGLVDRVDAAVADVRAQLATTASDLASQRLDEAARLAEVVRDQVDEVRSAAESAAAAADPSDLAALAERARSLADRIAGEAARVMTVVEEALDHARAAAAEAEALDSVRAEVASIAERADEAVERARAEAARIPSVIRNSALDPAPIVDEAVQHVQLATKAAAKVRAAVPLAAQADALPIAQSILRTARMALERANGGAEGVRAILERSVERIREEKEAAQRAVADARARAAEPGQDAAAAARKAEGWVEAGRRETLEVREDSTAHQSLKVLERAAAEVRRLADAAVAKASELEAAEGLSQVEALAPAVKAAGDQAVEAAERARGALVALRERIASVRAEAEAAVAVAAEAAEHAAAASQVAEQGEATLRELEQVIESSRTDELVASALETVRTAATNARFAAATAGQAAQRAASAKDRAAAEAAAEEANAALEDALDALERVVEAEVACRTTMEQRQKARAADSARSEAERRRTAEARVREQAEREQAEQASRRQREEERNANFERRNKERGRSTAPEPMPPQAPPPVLRATAASDRDSLREMLRKSRPTISGSGGSSGGGEDARPRRRSDSDGGGAADGRSEGRAVRSWSPSPRAPGSPHTAPVPLSNPATGTVHPITASVAFPSRPTRPTAERPNPRTGAVSAAPPEPPAPPTSRGPASSARARPAPPQPPPGSSAGPSAGPSTGAPSTAQPRTGGVPSAGQPRSSPSTRGGPPSQRVPTSARAAPSTGAGRTTSGTTSAETPQPAQPQQQSAPMPKPRPSPRTGANETPRVDELLERLRARRSEKD